MSQARKNVSALKATLRFATLNVELKTFLLETIKYTRHDKSTKTLYFGKKAYSPIHVEAGVKFTELLNIRLLPL